MSINDCFALVAQNILFHAGFNFAVGALGLVNGEPQLLTIFVVLMCAGALAAGSTMRRATASARYAERV